MQVLHSKSWFSWIPMCLQAQFSWMSPLGLWHSSSGLYPCCLFWGDVWSEIPWSLTIASTISWGVQGSLGQSSIACTNSHEIIWLACSLGSSLWSFLVWGNSLESPPLPFVVTNTFTCFPFTHVSMFWQHANHVICWGQLMQVMDHDITRSSLHTCKLVLAQQLCKTLIFIVFSWKYTAKPLWNQWNIEKCDATSTPGHADDICRCCSYFGGPPRQKITTKPLISLFSLKKYSKTLGLS